MGYELTIKDAPPGTGEPRIPMVVHCADCLHEFAPLFAPAPLDLVTKLLTHTACPSCGGKKLMMGWVP